ncbi:MAG: hemolysin III family protein [Gemmatimonadales bacterium]|jgi:hemolysin III
MRRPERVQSLGEEIANSVTHGVASLAFAAAIPFLVVAALPGGAASVVGSVVFGASLVLLYSSSTLYHSLARNRAKRVFRVIDHSAIYVLIAGTYTPFTLGVLRGVWGWTLFGVVWALAATGIALKASLGFRFPKASLAVYLAMGWLIVVAIKPLLTHLPLAGLAWLAAGGLCYTGGTAIYGWGRPRYQHTIWHLFVLAGSVCHWIAVAGYATPRLA